MTTVETFTTAELTLVTFDLYRDIHKAIRNELFAVTVDAGRLDPGDRFGVIALADQVGKVVGFLDQHAEHEDGAIQPVLEVHRPDLAERIADDHAALDARMEGLVRLAGEVAALGGGSARGALHRLYIELAAFTSSYLAHQDVEERIVMPALEEAVGVEAVLGIHGAIISGMPPHELTAGLASMFPAMNVDDRTELLGGMRATAPAEVFEGVWSLARSVLSATDLAAVAARLG